MGGGINGTGIARDAAGRGLSVILIERDDLGAHTSSASSKLIHGGLRYLEHYEFRLVREALREREVLLGIAPHIARPMKFILPHEPHLRPAWMIRAGLTVYDLLAGNMSLPRSRAVDLRKTEFGDGLKSEFVRGFAYSDAWVDDARLVVLNARSAADLGATILPRTSCVGGERANDHWRLTLRDEADGREYPIEARAVVNAAGAWAERLLKSNFGLPQEGRLRLVRGSHIVVPRLYAGDHAYILQNEDRRIVFMFPYAEEFTAIGTTDVPVDDPEPLPVISDDEIQYLCAIASRYSARTVVPIDIVNAWSGVRALFDDGRANASTVSRDYRLLVDDRGPPILSVFGGKITTYRVLAEQALHKLSSWFPSLGKPWTGTQPLPGGDFGALGFERLAQSYQSRYPQLPVAWLRALIRRHGTLATNFLGAAKTVGDLGESFGGGLYECEVRYLVGREWARTAEDVLWRRTKAGLKMSAAQVTRLENHLRETWSRDPPTMQTVRVDR